MFQLTPRPAHPSRFTGASQSLLFRVGENHPVTLAGDSTLRR